MTADGGPGTRFRARHILAVDDDPATRTLIARVLGVNYRVSTASSPREAMAVAGAAASIDLAILDVMMPEMDGFELAKRLRLIPSCAKAPIIFITARDTPTDKIRAIQAGARSYVVKPFSIDDLQARVKRAFGE
jgi:two-component system OmpR family response regulator